MGIVCWLNDPNVQCIGAIGDQHHWMRIGRIKFQMNNFSFIYGL